MTEEQLTRAKEIEVSVSNIKENQKKLESAKENWEKVEEEYKFLETRGVYVGSFPVSKKEYVAFLESQIKTCKVRTQELKDEFKKL